MPKAAKEIKRICEIGDELKEKLSLSYVEIDSKPNLIKSLK